MKLDDRIDDDMLDDKTEGKKGHKIMTMEDVAHELHKDFEGELSDCKRYMCMSRVADDAGAHHDSHYLLEMAKDEYTHACYIHDFLEKHDIDIPEAQEEEYKKLSEKMREFFW